MSVVVRIENLSKAFRLGVLNRRVLFEDWRRRLSGKQVADDDPHIFWALKDVSFDIRDGEVVGILGRNGAGKSTLLKIISHITGPTRGCVKIKGRVASLLEVGTGFHMELTGRDNIFLNGTVLGMTHREVARKFDDIVAFSGVEQFIDTPVKRYSVGMRVRLAFAVAANLEPEILVIDEVLAVGDAAFQQRCLGKIGEVSRSGRTVLFVSHNAASIESLCTRGVVLEAGRVVFDGTQTEAIEHYAATRSAATSDLAGRTDRHGSGEVRITGVELRNERGFPIPAARSGEDVELALHFERKGEGTFPRLAAQITVLTHLGAPVFFQANWLEVKSSAIFQKRGTLLCRIPRLPLPNGHFQVSYRLSPEMRGRREPLDQLDGAFELHVEGGDFFGSGKLPPAQGGGVCLVEGNWRLEGAAVPEPATVK
jgi:lipopolysaccharide transport system ATP-binding protein